MLEVEWYVVYVLSEKHCTLAQGMSVTSLVEHVLVPSSKIRNDYIRLRNLVIDSLKDTSLKDLLVDPLSVGPCSFTGGFDCQAVDIVEVRTKRHKHKYERLRTGFFGHDRSSEGLLAANLTYPAALRIKLNCSLRVQFLDQSREEFRSSFQRSDVLDAQAPDRPTSAIILQPSTRLPWHVLLPAPLGRLGASAPKFEQLICHPHLASNLPLHKILAWLKIFA